MNNYKISVVVLVLSSLCLLGCKKDSKNKTTNPPVAILDNTWAFSDFDRIKFTTFTVGSSSHYTFNVNQKGLLFKDKETGSKASLVVFFKTIPTAAGTYKIVRYTSDQLQNDNECSIIGTNESGAGFYCFTPYDNSAIEVTLKQGGKLAIAIPETNVTYAAPSGVYILKAAVYEK